MKTGTPAGEKPVRCTRVDHDGRLSRAAAKKPAPFAPFFFPRPYGVREVCCVEGGAYLTPPRRPRLRRPIPVDAGIARR